MVNNTPPFLVACLLGASAGAALAQDITRSPEPARDQPTESQPLPRERADANPASEWTVRLEPMLWWVSPSGRVRLPSSGASSGDRVRLERLNLDSPRFTPAGAVTIGAEEWRFSFNGATFSEDRNTTADSTFRLGDVSAAPGDALRTSFDYSTFEVAGGYRVLAYDFKARSATPGNAADLLLNVYAILGLRLTDVKIGIEKGAASSSSDQFFVEPIAGARAELEIARDFSVNLQVTGGGYGDSDRTAASLDIAVSFGWRPVENFGAEVGWRQILYSLNDGAGAGKFSYDGAMAGLFASVFIRF